MPELIAQGSQPDQRWRRRLGDGQTHIVGRETGGWSVTWDERISRRHVALSRGGSVLTVVKLPEARNPLFFLGQACDHCTLQPGQHFVIGSTTFSFVDEPVTIGHVGPVMTEHTFTAEQLRDVAFRDTARRIDALGRLPEVIPSDISDQELCSRLVHFLLAGVARATWVAVVAWQPMNAAEPIEILHWDHRPDSAAPAAISQDLIRQAVQGQLTVAHVWSGSAPLGQPPTGIPARWAYCTPLRRDASRGWCLYVAGGEARQAPRDAADLHDDVKFTELVADIVGRLRELRRLERRQGVLRQFISPVVMERLAEDDSDRLLLPRETEVSVLFCDLRGFSRVSEQSAHDLMGLLQRVSRALGVMTRHMLEQGGVVGDFHGDAAMGFWGWPLEQPDRIERACRAALAISAEFSAAAAQSDNPLADFRIGIGVATGRAVAGSIGSADQVKITVFGPVVNLAARLQDLTKILRAPILTDEATAHAVRQRVPSALARVRRVAPIRPRGMDRPVEVHEILPAATAHPLSDEHLAVYEAAVVQLVAGDWEQAFGLLHQVPAQDRVKDFLTVLIAQHHRTPPPDWSGVIDLSRT